MCQLSISCLFKSFFVHISNVIIRPYRSTTYIDAAYCYRPSSVVCWSVTLVSPAKTAKLIEMPFRLRTLMGPGNCVLDGGPDPPWERAIFWEKRRPIVKCRDTLRSSVQKQLNQSRCRLGFGLGWAQGIMLDGVHTCEGSLPWRPSFGFAWAIILVV